MLRSDKVIRSVELEDVTLTQEALGGLAAFSHWDRGEGRFQVEPVRLIDAIVKLDSSQFGPFDVGVQVISPTQQGPVTLKTQTIAWEKGVSEGVLEVKHIEMQQPVALLSAKTRLSRTLDAKPVFSSHAATTDQLDDTLRIKSPFTVYDGILHGFDLITAAVTLDAPIAAECNRARRRGGRHGSVRSGRRNGGKCEAGRARRGTARQQP